MGGGDVSEYAAIHARVRAMYAAMLPPETWEELCGASDLAALIDLLKETAYGPYIAEVEDSRLTPRRAAYQIRKHLAAAFDAIVQLTPATTRSLVSRLCRRYEVDNLKALLRGIETGKPWEQVNFVLFPLGEFTELPGQEMVEAESVAAAVELLRGTSYYETLSHAMKRYAEEQSLFPLEVALDLAYWRELWRAVGQLSNASRMPGRRIVGSLLDTNNLMWAIRYRVNHRLSEEEIINYTLPFGYRVRDEDIRAIAAAADIASIVRRIYPEVGAVASLLREPQSGIPELEVRLQRYNAGVYRNAFLGYPFHIGIPAAYLLLTEMEIQDLTVLLEAKSAQLPPERFRPHLLVGWASERY
jgi:V/A-type H+-transporting ATPase subunit C